MRPAFYVTTGLFTLAMIGAGLGDLLNPEIAAGLAHLGFPAWFATLLGVWKLLGAATIAAPGLPRLKEWAFAGFMFNLTSASVAHVMAGDPVGNVVTPLVLLAIGLAAWATRPANRRLGEVIPGRSAA